MIIAKPFFLLLLFLTIPIALLGIYSYTRGKKGLHRLGGQWRFDTLLNIFIVKNFFMYTFFILFVIFTALALADFRWDEQLVEDEREGYELILAIDISRSMLAGDSAPTRLQAVKEKIVWLMQSIPDAKFGIVIFKGKAVQIIPITDDTYALNLFLNTLSPDMITAPGSNVEEGLKVALESFSQAGKYRAILLFSDGENQAGNPRSVARKAGDAGIPVITVLCGSPAGAHIALTPGNYLRDESGKLVLSQADASLLEEIAQQSNGKAYTLSNFERIRRELIYITKQIEDENIDTGLKIEKKGKFEIFLSLALLFLILSILTRRVR